MSRRVALVTQRFPPDLGGVEVHVAELARRLGAHGWAPEVVTEARSSGRGTTAEGVPVLRFRRPRTRSPYTTAPGLWAHLARHGGDYDLVHAHNFHALPALASALLTRVPLVFTPHYHGLGTSSLGRVLHLAYRPAGRRLVSRAARIVCVSQAEAARFGRDFPGAGIVVIPNGIDAAALANAQPYDIDGPVILASGRLHRYKRVDRVLDAFARLGRPARLIVLGDGPARAELEERADASVRFLGMVPRDDVERWLRTATVYVSLSEQEAFGIGVAEGIGAGSRVVASDIPAHREIAGLAPGAVELVTAHTDVAAALRRALDAGRPNDIARLPDWDEVAARTAALYDEVA